MLIPALLLLLAITIFTGCARSEKEKIEAGKLLSFHYLFSDFRYRPFEYSITRIPNEEGEEQISFTASGYKGELIAVEEVIGEDIVNDIVAILEEEDIFAWDGFEEYDKEVRDGFSFSLRAKFENREIKAGGYVKRPKNFKEAHARLSEYLLNVALGLRED